MNPQNGQILLTNLTGTLNGRVLDQTYGLLLINRSRNRVQEIRNWKCMIAVDTSQTAASGNNYSVALNLPTGFMNFVDPERNGGYGRIMLFDGVNFVPLDEIAFELKAAFQNVFGKFAVDYANSKFYILGMTPRNYTVYIFFKQDLGDITLNTFWSQFPARYHHILYMRSAARWRLGTSIDDLNAENAADNDSEVKEMLNDMISWDTNLQLGATENIDYGRGRYGRNHGPNGYRYPY